MLFRSMEGEIYKWTNRIFGWQKYYAVIKNGEFRYYQKKNGNAKGMFSLAGSKIEMIDNDLLEIKIKLLDNNEILLKCETITDKVKWVNALSTIQINTPCDSKRKEKLLELINPDLKEVKNSLTDLLNAKIFNNSSELNTYLIQIYTFQGLLEGSLSDFAENMYRLNIKDDPLKSSIENIKRYTSELKV